MSYPPFYLGYYSHLESPNFIILGEQKKNCSLQILKLLHISEVSPVPFDMLYTFKYLRQNLSGACSTLHANICYFLLLSRQWVFGKLWGYAP